jgi:hypothetical protein
MRPWLTIIDYKLNIKCPRLTNCAGKNPGVGPDSPSRRLRRLQRTRERNDEAEFSGRTGSKQSGSERALFPAGRPGAVRIVFRLGLIYMATLFEEVDLTVHLQYVDKK